MAFVDGKYIEEFDNNYISKIYEGDFFISAEHYYQYHKSLIKEEKILILKERDIYNIYNLGHKVTLRPDWENIKLSVMFKAMYLKFNQNSKLYRILTDTKGEILFEGDNFWGNNKNWSGRILMAIRHLCNGNNIDSFLKEINYTPFF